MAPALSVAARRSIKRPFGIFAEDLIHEPESVWCAAPAERHRAGWDITFSMPKSFGILWAAGTAEQRAVLEKIQQDAVDQALELLVRERLVEVRLGAGGHRRDNPDDIIVAKFPHYTSREGDPACHLHCILLNVAGAFGKTFTVEPKKIFQNQLLLGAAMRTALAERLAELGFSLREAGRDQFEIAGITEPMIEGFSKRAQQIKARVGRDASAAQKEVAALATRRDKASVPTGADLEKRWKQELAAYEIDAWAIAREVGLARNLRRVPEIDHDFDPPEISGDTPVALAASAVFRTESVLTRKALLHRSFVESALQGKGINAVYSEISNLEASGRLVRLDDREAAQHWTTTAIAADEAKLLRLAKERVPGILFRPEAVELALQAAPFLSDEQRQAIRHATSSDPTTVLEAGAGTGKTTLIAGLADAAKLSGKGMKILGLAPSWVAADELCRSAGIEALAIARFRHELASGQRQAPDADTLVIIDEAGMASVRDLAAIFDAATLRNAAGEPGRSPKILLSGDRRQLAAVAGGNSLKAVSEIIERRATLTGVRRQLVDWQRAASITMAQGDLEAGLRVYAEHDCIDLVAGREAAQARAIQAWQYLRRSHGDDVILVTRRNRDAAELNLAARKVLREEGLIQGKDLNLIAVDRNGALGLLPLAIGDRIRFGELLHQYKIRNGTRGNVEEVTCQSNGSVRLAIRLEDGRTIEDEWSRFSQRGRRRHAGVPKIVHSIAGSAYSVQGRTALATVLHLGSAADARGIYVGLTRHVHDARIVVESERLDAACRARQEDPRMEPPRSALLDCLFGEAGRFHEKANVVDHVADRVEFIETGSIYLPRARGRLNVGAVVEAARRVELAAQHFGSRGRAITAQLRQLAMTFMPDWGMPREIKVVLAKLRSWAPLRASPEFRGLQHSRSYECGR